MVPVFLMLVSKVVGKNDEPLIPPENELVAREGPNPPEPEFKPEEVGVAG